MTSALRHVKSLWGPWWVLPGGLPIAYVVAIWAIGDLRPEHVVIPLIACVLAYATQRTRQFFIDVSPYLIVAFGYDAVRYARAALLTPERVLGCGLRDAELMLFRVAPGVTYQDYFAAHNSVAFDLVFALPYAVFAYVAFLYAAYLYFADRPRMRHYLWSFMIANYISFAFWLIVPAAPPWYIRAHGCAIDLSTLPSPAALTRVDQFLGVGYFGMFYSRAASVFGALPSMHCAYPLIGLLTAWKSISWKTKPIHLLYLVVMASAAVYLDHHWILDAIAGWLVAIVAVLAAKALLVRFNLLTEKETARDDDPPAPASQPA